MSSSTGLSNFSFWMSPQAGGRKAKINKRDYINLRRFCTAKETTSKTKRRPTRWEEVFVNHVSDKGLIITIYKELIELSS